MERLGRGRTAEVYRTEDDKALKLYHADVSESFITYETQIAKAVTSVCSAAPKFYGKTTLEGRKGLLYQIVEGTTLTEMIHQESVDINGLACRMAKAHQSIHATSTDDLPSMMDYFVPNLIRYGQLSDAGLQNLIAFIDRDKTEKICHGDLHPENVMEDNNGKLWIIDWTNADSGNPISDLARPLYLVLNGLPLNQTHIEPAERLMREQVVESFIPFYGSDDPRKSNDWDVWRLIILINRCFENIDSERPEIDRMIAEILKSRPEFA